MGTIWQLPQDKALKSEELASGPPAENSTPYMKQKLSYRKINEQNIQASNSFKEILRLRK